MNSRTVSFWLVSLCTLCSLSRPRPARAIDIPTAHYLIHSELDPRLSEDLAFRIEAMYAQYSARLVDFRPPTDRRFDVNLYRRREDYQKLAGDKFSTTGGIFIPGRNLLAAFLEGQGRDSLRRTLQHEAFHQFAFTAISPNLPVWLNEGIAQIFEEGIWVGDRFDIEQVPPRRIRQLQQDMRDQRLMPFKQFMTMSDADWTRDLRDAATGAARYNQAWAMTHFLIFAPDPDDPTKPRFRPRLINLLKFIHNGEKSSDAFVHAFSGNIDGFQQLFLEYVRALQPSPDPAFIERQSVLADLLIALNKEGKRYDDVEAFRKALTDGGYRLRYTKGNVQWSTETDPTAYFRDPQGRLMTHDQLFFSVRAGAPLPDIICKPEGDKLFRTVFHEDRDRIDHETLIESR